MNKYKNLDSFFEQEMGNIKRNRRSDRRNKDKFKEKGGQISRGWVVRGDRPEEIHESPDRYYNEEEIEKYTRSGGIRRTQEKIAYRIMGLLNLPEKSKLLDLGCGPGHTMNAYQNEGYIVTGIDVLPKMLEKARQNGLNVVEGDIRDMKQLFDDNTFDAVVSAAALQWIKSKRDMLAVAESINYVLKNKGQIAFQFYPKSQEELETFVSAFVEKGFEGDIITDNPDNPVKRTVYLVMKKL